MLLFTISPNMYKFCVLLLHRHIVKSSPVIPNYLSSECRDFIKRLLVKDPESRLGAKHGAVEIKSHPFFKVELTFNLQKPCVCVCVCLSVCLYACVIGMHMYVYVHVCA